MRFAKSFLAAFAVALFAFAATTPAPAPAAEQSIIWTDGAGNVDEVWLIYVDGQLDTI
ncbi:hypothetical protein [Longimicrobium sp.]|uniref:hypothetical protein n=1 Tax=Longimicrobium sp. TaxID=2029185 RepID=UPI002E312829|nr:hypothetical protein [Longimicrobium sp.]HEX6039376.1 hypothetical protein [Longimicrobium sp.]